MNSRVATTPPGPGWGWLVHPLLVSAMTLAAAPTTTLSARPESIGIPLNGRGESVPYLRLLGSPPLRFLEAIPPPDVSARPASAGPPKAGGKTDADIATSPSSAGQLAASSAAAALRLKPERPMPDKPAVSSSGLAAGPAPILPDDAGTKVKPEDFLPFFQFPANKAPQPGVLPPSTASYQQQ